MSLRTRRRKARERKELARALGRGIVWSVLFLGLLASLAGVVAMLVAEEPLYAALFLPSGVLLGWALWRWEGR